MNRVQLIGRVGKDATVNTVNGKNVINFSLCTTETWKDAQGQKKEKSTWFECSWWLNNTAIASYIKKGSQLFAEGSVEVRSYTTAAGAAGASLNVKISSVKLLSSGGTNESASAGEDHADAGDAADDLPF